MPEVSAGNTSIYYEIHGQGDPLILIAGLGSDLTQWHWQLPEYSKEFRCIVFNNRGITKIDEEPVVSESGPITFDLLASDVLRLMDHLEIDSAHIVGASMGGVIAQVFAVAYPERVLSLSLHSTLASSNALIKLIFGTQISLVKSLGLVEFMLSLAPWIWSEETLSGKPELIEEFRSLRKEPKFTLTKDVYIRQAEAFLDFSLLERLNKIKAPVLVTAGASDILINPRNSELIHKSVRGSEYSVFHGCGHASLVEASGDFNNKTLSFLKKHKGEIE